MTFRKKVAVTTTVALAIAFAAAFAATAQESRAGNSIPTRHGKYVVEQLRPLTFVQRGRLQAGFALGEARAIEPMLLMKDGDGRWVMDTEGVVAFLVVAVQDLQARVEFLESELCPSGTDCPTGGGR